MKQLPSNGAGALAVMFIAMIVIVPIFKNTAPVLPLDQFTDTHSTTAAPSFSPVAVAPDVIICETLAADGTLWFGYAPAGTDCSTLSHLLPSDLFVPPNCGDRRAYDRPADRDYCLKQIDAIERKRAI